MSLRINDTVPDFTADTSQGRISFHDWISDIEKYSSSSVGFPIITDEDMKVSKLYDMLPAEAHLPGGHTAADSATVRAV